MDIIRTYCDILEARMVKGLLENENIPAYIQGEAYASVNWLHINAIGGLRLVVNETDREKAEDIIRNYEEHSALCSKDYDERMCCPKCCSTNTHMYILSGFPAWFLSFAL